MIKKIIIFLIRLKNPSFSLDSRVSQDILIALIKEKVILIIRGNLILLFKFKRPSFFFAGKGVRFFNSSKIHLGKFIQLGDYAYLSALGDEGIFIGDNTSIGAYSRLVVSTSFNNIGRRIRIGKNVGIGEFAYLGGGGGLEIGDDCIIGQYLSCHPENHQFENKNILIRHQGTTRNGIKIGKNCWIGAKVTVLDGVTIGDNCVIAAGAVVNKKFPDNCVIGGVPAKILKAMPGPESEPVSIALPIKSELFQ